MRACSISAIAGRPTCLGRLAALPVRGRGAIFARRRSAQRAGSPSGLRVLLAVGPSAGGRFDIGLRPVPIRESPGLPGPAQSERAGPQQEPVLDPARASHAHWGVGVRGERDRDRREHDQRPAGGPPEGRGVASIQAGPDQATHGDGHPRPIRYPVWLRGDGGFADPVLHGDHHGSDRDVPGASGPRSTPGRRARVLSMDHLGAERGTSRRGLAVCAHRPERCEGRRLSVRVRQPAAARPAHRRRLLVAPRPGLPRRDVGLRPVAPVARPHRGRPRAAKRDRRCRRAVGVALAELRSVGRRRRLSHALSVVAGGCKGLRRGRCRAEPRPRSLPRGPHRHGSRPERARLLRSRRAGGLALGPRGPPLRFLRSQLERLRQAPRKPHPVFRGREDDLAARRLRPPRASAFAPSVRRHSNAFARNPAGVPTSLKDDVWTLRLQVDP